MTADEQEALKCKLRERIRKKAKPFYTIDPSTTYGDFLSAEDACQIIYNEFKKLEAKT